MDARNLTETECILHGTKSCALLNMRKCEECPLNGRVADPEIHRDLKTFCDLQPEGTVAQLFESKTCQLCKTEPKGETSCYAVFDMAHEEPKALARRRFLSRQTTGFMVPLQFACCPKCRRRMLIEAYLPLITPIVLLAAVLPFVMTEQIAQTLRQKAAWLPLLLVACALFGGYLIGKLLAWLYRKRCSDSMYTDVREHPFVKKMEEKGWRPLYNDRKPHIAFTKKRIAKGLGSAPSSVYALADVEIGEKGKISD